MLIDHTARLEALLAPVPEEQLKLGSYLLNTTATEFKQNSGEPWTANDVISNLDMPVSTRKDIIQSFFAKAEGQISLKAMERTLKMQRIGSVNPFVDHWEIYQERKARGLAKSPTLQVVKSA